VKALGRRYLADQPVKLSAVLRRRSCVRFRTQGRRTPISSTSLPARSGGPGSGCPSTPMTPLRRLRSFAGRPTGRLKSTHSGRSLPSTAMPALPHPAIALSYIWVSVGSWGAELPQAPTALLTTSNTGRLPRAAFGASATRFSPTVEPVGVHEQLDLVTRDSCGSRQALSCLIRSQSKKSSTVVVSVPKCSACRCRR